MGFKYRVTLIAIAVAIPIAFLWVAFFHTDEYGLTPWEYTQDVFVSDDWVGWIHPFGAEGRALKVGPFDSIKHCQRYAFEHLQREYDSWENAEYYCGYLCGADGAEQSEDECKLITK
jgi:hypothetical protein